ncbi:UvsX [Prochlorococcus phage P-SSM3]|jgi:RecA/RadA recombinase|uniref:UvsX n=1 Tax=Prochlorococcus phage P-SSM3 TaxID=536453 RepID=R9S7K5_9CAUD|nr:UvsX [Prochlorococcus phage P-SSM3]AGN12004.1 UvsX [Prochlorococcus phage P-SSM3]|tara:strand:- start:464 stop:1474 length:1011 start_codon:yes stop_codon:yes gene_type:complete
MNFLKDIAKEIGNDYASLVSEGVSAGDTAGFIDTGSYIFNALLSGSIYGGIPNNKITAIAGETSTGKTFFCLGMVQHFLESNPDAGVIYFESESAISKQMIEDRGIDSNRMLLVPVTTVQEFRLQSIKILDKYNEQTAEERKPLMFVLDSLGMLSTSKEVEDSEAGKETRDMTRAQVVKSIFRVLTLKLGKANVPLIVTNHTYDVVGAYIPTKEMGGGSGLKYAASTIVYLSKKKEKNGKEVVGNIIKCKTAKSRLTKENSDVETRLYYDRGLDRYYGLLELGEKHGVFSRKGNRIVVGDSSVYPSAILADPDKYFTEELMEKLDEAAAKEFRYGN